MRFSLELTWVLMEMGNEYDEDMEEVGVDVRKVIDKLKKGELKFSIMSTTIGDYLVLDVPDELIER